MDVEKRLTDRQAAERKDTENNRVFVRGEVR